MTRVKGQMRTANKGMPLKEEALFIESQPNTVLSEYVGSEEPSNRIVFNLIG